MNKFLQIAIVFLCFGFFAHSQDNSSPSQDDPPEIYFMKGVDGQHYINNEIYYALKFYGGEITYLDRGSFKINDHIINIIEADYDQSVYHNGKSVDDEKKVLRLYKDKEVKTFEEAVKMKITAKEEFFNNKDGKLFYLFSYDVPIEKVNVEEDYLRCMYILCFVVNNKLSTISFPLFKSESEEDKRNYINALCESVDIFPATISLEFFKRRVLNTNNEPLAMNYEGANFKFVVPNYLNVLHSEDETQWYASFPDVNNVKNAVVVNITEKKNYKSFKAFNKEVLPQGKIGEDDGSMTLILKEELENVGQINGKSLRFQYMPAGSMRFYHAKKVTFETKNYYGIVLFNATTETYVDNIDRFDAFLESFEIITD